MKKKYKGSCICPKDNTNINWYYIQTSNGIFITNTERYLNCYDFKKIAKLYTFGIECPKCGHRFYNSYTENELLIESI